jgi:tetratricopeptide (TPR) repeat protein
MLSRVLMLIALSISLAPVPLAAQEHEHGPAPGEKLGSVDFPVSCAPEARADFERAVAMLHSFWFAQAEAAFRDVAAADPGCAMASWGLAMTLWGNPMARVAPPEERAAQALEAAEAAAALSASVTERERGFIEAALALYRDQGSVDYLTRMKRHEDAMLRVHEENPDDVEAAIFYARAVVANASPDDLTFQRQMHAASIMEPMFQARPDHPGLAHYLIHAYDAPPIAQRGVDAARRYASIAPAAPHALHMPSHIFTRLGYWDESIETNRRSADAEENPDAAVHPLDYMVYAYLQQGRDEEARAVVGRTVQLPDRFYQSLVGYNFTAMPARLALERSRWEEAAELLVPQGAPPHVEAITRFARAVGAARSGRPDPARGDVAALETLRDVLKAKNDVYWATVVEAQRQAAAAWLARAEGDDDAALRLAHEAAEIEGRIEKHPITPGPLLPARELEGDLLLELDRPAEALAAYRNTLEREPRRARSLYGAARAAEAGGDEAAAGGYYAQLVELMAADSPREELARARAYLARSTSSRR